MIVPFPALQGKNTLLTPLQALSTDSLVFSLCFLGAAWRRGFIFFTCSSEINSCRLCYILHCVSQKAKAAVSVSVGVHPGPQKLQKGFLFHRLTL